MTRLSHPQRFRGTTSGTIRNVNAWAGELIHNDFARVLVVFGGNRRRRTTDTCHTSHDQHDGHDRRRHHPGTQQYISTPNTIAGGSEPQVPGATGIQPNPKQVAIKRFHCIGQRHYRKDARVKGKQPAIVQETSEMMGGSLPTERSVRYDDTMPSSLRQ